jgi:release factor glutamine methyltransferase
VTLSSLLAAVRQTLRSYGVINPDVEAETIIAHVLGLKRTEIYLEPGRQVDPGDHVRILEIVGERERRFPLQYLLGEVEFMGLPLRMRQGVFIPRPETEILVETLIARAAGAGAVRNILDVGTGSGAIAVALAKYLKPQMVVALDVSREAAELTQTNARLNGVARVVAPVVGDGLAPIRSAGEARAVFDLVVTNPPYVETAEIDRLQPEVRDYEPRLALDGGADGLAFIAGVLPGIPSILRKGSIVAFEIGATQAEAVSGLFGRAGLREIEVVRDLAGRDRIILGVM